MVHSLSCLRGNRCRKLDKKRSRALVLQTAKIYFPGVADFLSILNRRCLHCWFGTNDFQDVSLASFDHAIGLTPNDRIASSAACLRQRLLHLHRLDDPGRPRIWISFRWQHNDLHRRLWWLHKEIASSPRNSALFWGPRYPDLRIIVVRSHCECSENLAVHSDPSASPEHPAGRPLPCSLRLPRIPGPR